MLLDFYGNCNNAILKTNFEKLLGTRFEDRYREITKPGHWGEQIELYALATIHRVKFSKITVDDITSLQVLPSLSATVHRLDSRGRRISKVQTMIRGAHLIFCKHDHNGITIPVLFSQEAH